MSLPFDTAFARCSPPLLALFVVAGCAALGPTQAPGSEAAAGPAVPALDPAGQRPSGLEPPAAGSAATPVAGSPYYQVLVAEVAGHRGRLDLAVANYLAVARATRDPRVAERAVRVAAFAQDDAATLEAAKLWVQVVPTSHEARRILAGLYLRADRIDEAVVEMRALFEALKTTPAQTYALLVEMLSREADENAAFVAMERFVAGQEDDPQAQIALANLSLRRGRLDRATELLHRALARAPDDLAANLLFAQVLQTQGRAEEAADFLGQAVARQPDQAGLRVAYGRLLVAAKRYELAAREFQKVVEGNPENSEARYALALLLLQTERLDEAEQHLRILATRSPRQLNARFYLGQVAESRNRADEALSWYRQVDQGEHFVDAQVRVGVLLARQGRMEEARQHLQGVEVASAKDQVRLYQVEAELLAEAGRLDDAMSVYDLALSENADEADLLYSRAMLAEKMGRIDLLERDLRAILAHDPDHAQALNALGYTLADRTDRYEEAHELIAKALAQRPDDYFILDSMGWVLYRMGRYPEAVEHLRRAAAASDDAEIAAHLGEVLWVMGDQAGAREVWEAALARHPADQKLKEVMQRFLQ
jgi:tetratricopeptide (TPR) repeat protein